MSLFNGDTIFSTYTNIKYGPLKSKIHIKHNYIHMLHFIAILMLFLVIFEDDKSGNFLRGDKSFRTLKRTKSRQKQSKGRSVKVSFTSLLEKVKTDIFVNVIYKLIYLLLKIQEIFTSGLANLVKQTRACALVCFHDLQLPREIFPGPVFSTKGGLISIYTKSRYLGDLNIACVNMTNRYNLKRVRI